MLEQRGNKWYIWREKARNHYLKEEKKQQYSFYALSFLFFKRKS